tara:strand:+ start:255 stop:422 length:168 start_codon:yes stop_codon:yes gene_type:complete
MTTLTISSVKLVIFLEMLKIKAHKILIIITGNILLFIKIIKDFKIKLKIDLILKV